MNAQTTARTAGPAHRNWHSAAELAGIRGDLTASMVQELRGSDVFIQSVDDFECVPYYVEILTAAEISRCYHAALAKAGAL